MPDDRPAHSGPESLQAPWRLAYLEAEDKKQRDARAGAGPSGGSSPSQAGSGSFLLDYWNAPERDGPNHVIVRVPDRFTNPRTPKPHADDERSPGGRSESSRSISSPMPASGAGPAALADWSGPGGLVLLNKYPYSNGHLLVCLSVARGRLVDYSFVERAAFWRLVDVAADLMERTLQPQGINFGVNQGRAGGAGVPQHLHAHLVPRWAGDVNYMTTIGNVRVNPASLEAMAERYRRVWRG